MRALLLSLTTSIIKSKRFPGQSRLEIRLARPYGRSDARHPVHPSLYLPTSRGGGGITSAAGLGCLGLPPRAAGTGIRVLPAAAGWLEVTTAEPRCGAAFGTQALLRQPANAGELLLQGWRSTRTFGYCCAAPPAPGLQSGFHPQTGLSTLLPVRSKARLSPESNDSDVRCRGSDARCSDSDAGCCETTQLACRYISGCWEVWYPDHTRPGGNQLGGARGGNRDWRASGGITNTDTLPDTHARTRARTRARAPTHTRTKRRTSSVSGPGDGGRQPTSCGAAAAPPRVGTDCDGSAQGWQGRWGARGAGRQKAAPPAGARGAAKFRGR